MPEPAIHRRQAILQMGTAVWPTAASLSVSGCGPSDPGGGRLIAAWGRRGIVEGRLQKPRAVAIDNDDHLYIVDMTARIQVFDIRGKYLRGWRTPVSANGKPSGLTVGPDSTLLVADTHYFRLLCYTLQGELLEERTIGGRPGNAPGEFGFVTDAVCDSHGHYFVAEYGEYDRIQKFSPQGRFMRQWGAHGSEAGQFIRPQNLAVDRDDNIWVTDACNHRIQVFDTDGRRIGGWGNAGHAPGALYYPYDLALDGQGHIFVCEFGNSRVQKFNRQGRSLGCWGTWGRKPGQLNNPWALACDSQGGIHVVDTNNHRVQHIKL